MINTLNKILCFKLKLRFNLVICQYLIIVKYIDGYTLKHLLILVKSLIRT